MTKRFLLVIWMLLSVLVTGSTVSASNQLAEPDLPLPTIQACPEGSGPAAVCTVDGEGKVIAKGTFVTMEFDKNRTDIIRTLNTELLRRSKDQDKLNDAIRKRDRELDKREALLVQYQTELGEHRQKLLELEERKLAAQEKHTAAIQQQNDYLNEQIEAANRSNRVQSQIATAVQVVIPSSLLVGLLLAALIVRSSIKSAFSRFGESFKDTLSNLEEGLKGTLGHIEIRLSEINKTWHDYFVAQAKRDNIEYPPKVVELPKKHSNGNGHRRGDTIPPMPREALEKLEETPEVAIEPVSEALAPESKLTDRAKVSTDAHLQSLDEKFGSPRNDYAVNAEQVTKEYKQFPLETPDPKLEDTISEKPRTFWMSVGSLLGLPGIPKVAN